MDNIEIRKLSKLDYRDPTRFLVELRKLKIEVCLSQASDSVRHLRTNGLKSLRELREAAIFCHMMGQRIGTTVYLSPVEAEDYDFIALHVLDGRTHYSKVQLKELPPNDLPGTRSVDGLISTLSKYGRAPDLCVAIHLNRRIHVDPSEITVPQEARGIGSLWMFGAITVNQSRWGLWGDLLESQSFGTSHIYPE